jgi:hypothetical protein
MSNTTGKEIQMASPKIETAETAAKEVSAALQPVIEFNGFDRLKAPVKPTPKPLPADLARALGQS